MAHGSAVCSFVLSNGSRHTSTGRQRGADRLDTRRLYAFVESRIARGMFEPAAFSRAARTISALGRPDFPPVQRDDALPCAWGAWDTAKPPPSARCTTDILKPPVGHVFSLGVFDRTRLVGVAIVGRPVARLLDDGRTLEITRVAADGTRNACSALLGSCRREARRRSIARLVTYTLPSESGVSLRAAGFRVEGAAGGGSWNRTLRPRTADQPVERKTRWIA